MMTQWPAGHEKCNVTSQSDSIKQWYFKQLYFRNWACYVYISLSLSVYEHVYMYMLYVNVLHMYSTCIAHVQRMYDTCTVTHLVCAYMYTNVDVYKLIMRTNSKESMHEWCNIWYKNLQYTTDAIFVKNKMT